MSFGRSRDFQATSQAASHRKAEEEARVLRSSLHHEKGGFLHFQVVTCGNIYGEIRLVSFYNGRF